MSESEAGKTAEALRQALLLAQTSKEPIPVAPFEYADQLQFDACLRPRQALEAMGLEIETAITQLHRELAVRRIVAIADQVVWQKDGQSWRAYFLFVPPWVWTHKQYAKDDFWDTGYLYRLFPTKGLMGDRENWIELFDVRFLLAAKAAPLKATEAEKPIVKRGDLAKWHEIFKAVQPSASEALAVRSAAAMFPDNRVPRQWVRDLRGPQSMGKPKARY